MRSRLTRRPSVSRLFLSLSAGLLSLAGFAAAPAAAQVVTNDPSLPPALGEYQTSPGATIDYAAPGLTVQLSDFVLSGFSGISYPPAGADEMQTYNAGFSANATVTPPGATFPTSGNGPVVTIAYGKAGLITGTFDTEMLQLNLASVTPLGPALLRESPTLPSRGQTSITDIGGGLYRIDSFFDVFTELSIDGGQNWVPSSNAPARITLVPEPGIGIAAAAIAGVVLLARPRRRHA